MTSSPFSNRDTTRTRRRFKLWEFLCHNWTHFPRPYSAIPSSRAGGSDVIRRFAHVKRADASAAIWRHPNDGSIPPPPSSFVHAHTILRVCVDEGKRAGPRGVIMLLLCFLSHTHTHTRQPSTHIHTHTHTHHSGHYQIEPRTCLLPPIPSQSLYQPTLEFLSIIQKHVYVQLDFGPCKRWGCKSEPRAVSQPCQQFVQKKSISCWATTTLAPVRILNPTILARKVPSSVFASKNDSFFFYELNFGLFLKQERWLQILKLRVIPERNRMSKRKTKDNVQTCVNESYSDGKLFNLRQGCVSKAANFLESTRRSVNRLE